MPVLVHAESQNGRLKKSALEGTYFGHQTARSMDTECIALLFEELEDASELGLHGADRILLVQDEKLSHFDGQVYASVLASVAQEVQAELVVVPHSSRGKSILGRLAVKLEAGVVSSVNEIPQTADSFQIHRPVFSGKATATYALDTPVKVISLMGNTVQPEAVGSPVPVEIFEVEVPPSRIRVLETTTVEGTVPLPEAERVVSAGRGMKGPENWGIIEELAMELKAATACSRPVADSGWRPHYEHVGQTGLTIKPNLYIAVGISGAIQHLAGVNNSKVIVVINKDPEAPFFKAADYGVCADLFDVVPDLIKALRERK